MRADSQWSQSRGRIADVAMSDNDRARGRAALPNLPSIFEVVPVGPQDEQCFAEVRAVLERHDALQRFGLTLLHRHFDMADDELLIESIDVDGRVLTLRPERLDSPDLGIETSWRLDDPVAQRRCEVQCIPITNQGRVVGHDRQHFQTS